MRPACTLLPDYNFFYLSTPTTRRTVKKPWYSSQNMGHNRITKITKLLAKHSGINWKYTNHSIRRTTCSQLVQDGVPVTVVTQLKGHKNIGSLLGYATAGLQQQKDVSDILQKKAPKRSLPFTESTKACCTSTNPCEFQSALEASAAKESKPL